MNNEINNKDYYNGLSVLFVDDDSGFISSIKRALIDEDFKKYFAQSGMEALEVLQHKNINVIIVDMKMPGMDGISLLHKVKKNYPDIIRMILTAYTNPVEILESINSGEVYRYIVKPLKSTNELKSYIRDAMEYYNLKMMEKKLHESEQRYRVLFESSPDGIAISNIQTKKLVYVNPSLCKLVDYCSEELVKKKLIDISPDDRREYVISEFNSLEKGEKSLIKNIPIELKNGKLKFVDINTAQMTIGNEDYLVNFFRDITIRKNVEEALKRANDELEIRVKERTEELFKISEQLKNELKERKHKEQVIKASLKEKEVLLREIQHRVRNNLQVVISLLRLQSKHITDKKAIDVLVETQNRVKSMALIHGRLYQSKDLANINFGEYINGLINHLLTTYKVSPASIKTEVNVDNMISSIAMATPCGLIINELVSNTFKHAFPDEQNGEILIDLHSDNNNQCVLTVKDNGVGLPEKFDIKKSKTLGMQLISALVEQLDGKLGINRNGGTTFKLIFSLY